MRDALSFLKPLLAAAGLAALSVAASMDAFSVQDAPDQTSACPVTLRPERVFVPPYPYLRRPPEAVSFWYGTPALWTQI